MKWIEVVTCHPRTSFYTPVIFWNFTIGISIIPIIVWWVALKRSSKILVMWLPLIVAIALPTVLVVSFPHVFAGRSISVHVRGLLPTDSTCTISSPSSPNVIFPGSAACVIQLGSGVAHGGFIVGNVLPGSYVIQVTGNQGDSAQTILSVYWLANRIVAKQLA